MFIFFYDTVGQVKIKLFFYINLTTDMSCRQHLSKTLFYTDNQQIKCESLDELARRSTSAVLRRALCIKQKKNLNT